MTERWACDARVLQRLSHHVRLGVPLPPRDAARCAALLSCLAQSSAVELQEQVVGVLADVGMHVQLAGAEGAVPGGGSRAGLQSRVGAGEVVQLGRMAVRQARWQGGAVLGGGWPAADTLGLRRDKGLGCTSQQAGIQQRGRTEEQGQELLLDRMLVDCPPDPVPAVCEPLAVNLEALAWADSQAVVGGAQVRRECARVTTLKKFKCTECLNFEL